MKTLIIGILLSTAITTQAAETRIYQTDKYGNTQYDKPSLIVESNGRVVQADKYGNKQYHKPYLVVEPNGRVIQTDPYGNKQYNKPQYVLKGGQLVPQSSRGNAGSKTPTLKQQ